MAAFLMTFLVLRFASGFDVAFATGFVNILTRDALGLGLSFAVRLGESLALDFLRTPDLPDLAAALGVGLEEALDAGFLVVFLAMEGEDSGRAGVKDGAQATGWG